MNITFDIDPTKIDKTLVRMTKKGERRYDFRIVRNKDGKNQWGDDGFVAQVVPKEMKAKHPERGPIVGNWRQWESQGAPKQQDLKPTTAPKIDPDEDDVPF